MIEGDHDQRELRIAPVMTGGTSLSVWMGGATVELYSMLREGEDAAGHVDGSIYRRLCALTRTRPVIDVITGTSAGGLNGALLAAGVAYRVDQTTFSELRSTWMQVADITELMRDPVSDSAPVSLLDGAEKFRRPVQELITRWRDAAPQPSRDDPGDVDLVTTYTSIEPRDKTNVDDFGEEMSEISFAGTLRFTREDFLASHQGQDAATKLAHAAKASASLPGVFEPSELGWWGDDSPDPDSRTPPNLFQNLAEKSDFGSQSVVDGGVVVNMPLTEALDRIYSRPADTLVRRVVVYVCPTPRVPLRTHVQNRHARCVDVAATPADKDKATVSPAGDSSPPKLRKALTTIVTAPRAEGISADLRDIEQHNRSVRQQRSTRSTLGWLLGRGSDPLAQGQTTAAETDLMSLYRSARAEDSIESLFERLRPVLGAKSPIDPKLVRASLIQAREEQLPDTLPVGRVAESEWRWGVAPVEESVSTLTSIFNRVLGLPITDWAGSASDGDLTAALTGLQSHRADLQQVVDDCRRIRGYDDTYWAVRLTGLTQQHEVSTEELERFASSGFAEWPELTAEENRSDSPVTRTAVLEQLRSGFLTVARIVQAVHPALSIILQAAGADQTAADGAGGLREETRQEARGLAMELAALRSGGNIDQICWALLRLHVMQTMMIGRVQRREQRVEILQVSWNTPDYLTGRGPEEKLVGTEAARLGAFLKPSWRANDYFWGRMDAAPRLLQLLADPRRLVQVGVTSAQLCAALEIDPDARLIKELGFLDSTDRSIPHRLPWLVEILARRRQLEIAREELPHIAATIGGPDTPKRRGVAVPEQARRFRDVANGLSERPSDFDIEQELCAMRVGEENLATESGSALLNLVVTNASAVAIDAVLARDSGIPLPRLLRRALKITRRPVVGLVGRRLLRRFSRGGVPAATYTCRVAERVPA